MIAISSYNFCSSTMTLLKTIKSIKNKNKLGLRILTKPMAKHTFIL